MLTLVCLKTPHVSFQDNLSSCVWYYNKLSWSATFNQNLAKGICAFAFTHYIVVYVFQLYALFILGKGGEMERIKVYVV